VRTLKSINRKPISWW